MIMAKTYSNGEEEKLAIQVNIKYYSAISAQYLLKAWKRLLAIFESNLKETHPADNEMKYLMS